MAKDLKFKSVKVEMPKIVIKRGGDKNAGHKKGQKEPVRKTKQG